MKTKRSGRFLSVLLALMVCVVFTVPFTQVADAASKKTFYVPTKITNSYTFDGQTDTFTTTYKYNKNGLRTTAKFNDGSKTTYKRNKKGVIKSWKTTDKKGKTTASGTCKIKGSKIVSEKIYSYNGKKKTLNSTITYTFSGNTLTREESVYSDGDRFISEFDSNGNVTKDVLFMKGGSTMTTVHAIKVDDHGNVISDVQTITNVFDGNTSTDVVTTNTVYTYNKAGKITNEVSTTTNSDGKVTSTSTTAYKYKKVKAAKKYWKLLAQ